MNKKSKVLLILAGLLLVSVFLLFNRNNKSVTVGSYNNFTEYLTNMDSDNTDFNVYAKESNHRESLSLQTGILGGNPTGWSISTTGDGTFKINDNIGTMGGGKLLRLFCSTGSNSIRAHFDFTPQQTAKVDFYLLLEVNNLIVKLQDINGAESVVILFDFDYNIYIYNGSWHNSGLNYELNTRFRITIEANSDTYELTLIKDNIETVNGQYFKIESGLDIKRLSFGHGEWGKQTQCFIDAIGIDSIDDYSQHDNKRYEQIPNTVSAFDNGVLLIDSPYSYQEYHRFYDTNNFYQLNGYALTIGDYWDYKVDKTTNPATNNRYLEISTLIVDFDKIEDSIDNVYDKYIEQSTFALFKDSGGVSEYLGQFMVSFEVNSINFVVEFKLLNENNNIEYNGGWGITNFHPDNSIEIDIKIRNGLMSNGDNGLIIRTDLYKDSSSTPIFTHTCESLEFNTPADYENVDIKFLKTLDYELDDVANNDRYSYLNKIRIMKSKILENHNSFYVSPRLYGVSGYTDITPPSKPDSVLTWVYQSFYIVDGVDENLDVGNAITKTYNSSSIEISKWIIEYAILAVDYKNAEHYVQIIDPVSWGDWGIWNFVRDVLAFILNVLIIFINLIYYLLLLGFNYIIMFLIIGIISAFIWNVIIKYIFWAMLWGLWFLCLFLLWIYDMLILFIIWIVEILIWVANWLWKNLIIPIWEWFWNEMFPVCVEIVYAVLAFILATIIWALTGTTADFWQIYTQINVFLHLIGEFLFESIVFFVNNIPAILLSIVNYLICIGLLYERAYYCKSRGYIDRAERLEAVLSVYMVPIFFILSLIRKAYSLIGMGGGGED